MQAKCDECGEVFDYEQKTASRDGVDIYYSECPYCVNRELINVFDEEVKKLINKTKRLKKKHADSKNAREERRSWNRVLENLEKTKKVVEDKKREYSLVINEIIQNSK